MNDRRSRRRAVMLGAVALALVAGCSGPSIPDGRGPDTTLSPGGGQTSSGPPPVVAGSPPDWIQPGTRLTFYGAAASIALSRYQLVEDPNCGPDIPGCYLQESTGKWYRKTDEGPGGQGATTASGDGLVQTDVIAVDGGTVVLVVNSYVFDRTFNQFLLTPMGGTRAPGSGALSQDWIHPAELAGLAQVGTGDQLVLRGAYELGGVTYDAILFWSQGGGGHTSLTYDLQSGVLLAFNSSTSGAASTVYVQGDAPPVGNTQLTMSRLAGVRQRDVPGVGGQNPDWVAGTRELRYAGSLTWVNVIDPSAGTLTYSLQHTVEVGRGGDNWTPTVARTVVPEMFLDERLDTMSGPTGLYWYDPAALQSMSVGQLLDEDPLTGERLVVAEIAPGANGAIVTLASDLPGVRTRMTYDIGSGVLLDYELHQGSTGITIGFSLIEVV